MWGRKKKKTIDLDTLKEITKIVSDSDLRKRKSIDPLTNYKVMRDLIDDEMENYDLGETQGGGNMEDMAFMKLLDTISDAKANSTTQQTTLAAPPLSNTITITPKVAMITNLIRGKVPKKYLSQLKGLSQEEIDGIIQGLKQ